MIFDSIYYHIDNNCILDGIYLKVEPGSVCGVFGLNGSGKTTLIKIGAGIINPLSGSIFIDGKVFVYKSKYLRYKSVSYLCQDSFLPKDISVRKLIDSFRIKDNSDYIYKNLHTDLLNQKIRNLSGGEHRLLEFILIISLNRPFILLDEPFTGIEPKIIEKIINLISIERDNGKGILLTDHYHHYTSTIVDTAYLLKNGKCFRINSKNAKEIYLNDNF